MQWNAGGWFGGQLGATVWMLVAGVLAAIRDIPTGLIVVLLFTIPNVIGVWLWRTRKMSCYAATQLLIGISGVSGILTVYVLDQGNAWEQIQSGGTVSALSSYGIIMLVFGVLMLTFYLRFGRTTDGPKA